jgi:hypothetical protein
MLGLIAQQEVPQRFSANVRVVRDILQKVILPLGCCLALESVSLRRF